VFPPLLPPNEKIFGAYLEIPKTLKNIPYRTTECNISPLTKLLTVGDILKDKDQTQM
jgi:hypothetical protein